MSFLSKASTNIFSRGKRSLAISQPGSPQAPNTLWRSLRSYAQLHHVLVCSYFLLRGGDSAEK